MTNQTTNTMISTSTGLLIQKAVSSNEGTSKKWLQASDALYADGVTADMLTGKEVVAEVAASVKASIVLGFTDGERKLLALDKKAVPEDAKGDRKKVQQKVGVYIALIQKYLKSLDAPEGGEGEAEGGEGEAEKVEKTTAEKLKIVLETALKLVQGDEQPAKYNPVTYAKLLNGMIVELSK